MCCRRSCRRCSWYRPVGPPALLPGGTSRRRVGSRQRPVFPTHTARGHVGRVRGVSESTVRSFKVGQEALGNQGHRCGLGAVFVLEERFIGELRQLIVVVWVPNSRCRIQINTRLVSVFNGVGVHLHGRTRHRFPSGRLMVPSTRFCKSLPSRISTSTLSSPLANVVTLAEAKGARSINNTRNIGFVFRCVSFDMVSLHLGEGLSPKISSLIGLGPFFHLIGEKNEYEL